MMQRLHLLHATVSGKHSRLPYQRPIVGWLTTLLLLLGPASWAQAPNWQWLTELQAPVQATATDAAGNIIMVGSFSGTVHFGASTLTSTPNPNLGGTYTDGYIAKWNPVSGFAWAYQLGGIESDEASAIAIAGNTIYVGGSFRSTTANFGALQLRNSSTSWCPGEGSASDLFVLKLIDLGSSARFVWAQRPEGSYSEYCRGLTVQGNQVYINGVASGTLYRSGPGGTGCTILNTLVVGPTTFTTVGPNPDVFVAKLIDAGGNASFAWALQLGSDYTDTMSSLVVQGNTLYLAGSFSGYFLYIGPAVTGQHVLSNMGNGSSDGFVAKVIDNGSSASLRWVKHFGHTDYDEISSLAVAGTDLYVAGSMQGSWPAGNIMLTSAGGTDGFVARLHDTGSTADVTWAQRLGGPDGDRVTQLLLRGSSLYVAGSSNGTTADIGGITLTNSWPSSPMMMSFFVARIPDVATGTIGWMQSATGPSGGVVDEFTSLGNQLCLFGRTESRMTFPPLNFQNVTAPSVPFMATLLEPTLASRGPAAPLAGFHLSPIPAHGAVLVQLPDLPAATTATLSVCDALGRCVRPVRPLALSKAGTSYSLDLAGLAPGLYLVLLSSGGTQLMRRLVVE